MNTKEKHRKPKNVVLCRSSKTDPSIHGKEIQGLVFDHPSMPKIVTVSSVARKTSSSKTPAGHHAQEQNPTRHYIREQYPTGQRLPEQHLTGPRTPEQYPTGHCAPGQHPTGHRAPEQYPSRSSPPALIRTHSSQYSTGVQIPRGYRESHRDQHSGAKTAEQIAETAKHEAGRSQICFPSYYRQVSAPSSTISLSETLPHYPQHETHATQQRRNSVGGLRHNSEHGVQNSEHGVQHSENSVQHSENSVEHLETLAREERAKKENVGTDKFSRDFHLEIWRESHRRAARNWNPPVSGSGQPARLPPTSRHNVDTSVPMARFRSLSTSAGHSAVFRGENLPYHVEERVDLQQRSSLHPPSIQRMQYATDLQSTGDVRRYSTGHPGLLHAEVCTTKEFNPRVRSAEGTTSKVSSPESIRKSSSTTGEYNPVVRSAEGTRLRLLTSGNIRTSSSTTEEYNPVVRSAEGTDSEVLRPGDIKQSRRHEAEAQAIKMQQSHSPLIISKRQKQQQPTTVVVISDSDDEEMNISSPISNYDSDQDVFMVTKETGPNKRSVEPDCAESIVVCGSLSSGSMHESDIEEGCYITNVKRPGNNSEQCARSKNKINSDESQNQKSTWLSMTNKESRWYDVNNNEQPSHKGVGPIYRSVLYEREFAGHSSTQRVVMSEQSFFDKDTRGTKRTLEDKAEYFVAGAAEAAGCALDTIARKIRRISYDELESKNSIRKTSGSDTCHQSLQACVYSGENSKPRDHDDIPTLVRSRSENDEQINRQKGKTERTCHQSSQDCVHYGENPKPRDHDDMPKLVPPHSENDDQISPRGKIERSISPINDHRTSASQQRNTNDGTISPYVEPGASNVTSRDEFRCRNCDGAPTEKPSPGTEGSHTAVKLPKAGPKPTGIVVGVKQAPEAKQPLESSAVGSKNAAKDSCIKCADDFICKDPKSAKSGKVDQELDILHFKIVKKDEADLTLTNAKDHVKLTGKPRDQVPLSQQWQAYTLKLEQERIAKKSCVEKLKNKPNEENGVIKRNSWEELKRKFDHEIEQSPIQKSNTKVYHRKNVTYSDFSSLKARANATRTRVRSWNTVLGGSGKSLKFHDATEILAEQYKRRKLSEESRSEVVLARPNTSETNSNTTSSEAQGKPKQNQVGLTKPRTSLPESCKLLLLTKSPTKTPLTKIKEAISDINSREKVPLKTQDLNPSAVLSSEVRPSEVKHSEVKSPELTSSEVRHSQLQISEVIPSEVRPSEVRPSEVKHSEVNTQENVSSEIQPPDIRPKPTGVAFQGKDSHAEKNPPQQEELTMQQWIEILKGRIAQVRESIDEETTPWKKKNKRKVLEKLEHNYDWMTGPYVDEALFFSRRLQFFQTMRKQYELMKKVKNQRKVMKVTDIAPTQAKAAKEVTVAGKSKEITKTKEVKKIVKCKPKSVKNNGRGFMKKIRKAVLS